MNWDELRAVTVTVRPLSGVRPAAGGKRAQFRAALHVTLKELKRELRALDGERVVVELDVREQDIRQDGYPRARTPEPRNPTVAISFASVHGPLRYATCEFGDWEDNLRAIVLSMQALRAVDRYGVSKRGEQYQGWKALPTSTDPADAIQNVGQAWELIMRVAEVSGDPSRWDQPARLSVLRKAIKATHPDRGGDADEFRQVERSRAILIAAGDFPS